MFKVACNGLGSSIYDALIEGASGTQKKLANLDFLTIKTKYQINVYIVSWMSYNLSYNLSSSMTAYIVCCKTSFS